MIKRTARIFASAMVTLLVSAQVCPAQTRRAVVGAIGETEAQDRLMHETRVKGGIATLYALDPLARTLCFDDGKDGQVFQADEVRNRCSHIDFNNYNEGALTVGIQGGQNGMIVDLGTSDELQRQYGYEETVGKGNGFASLQARASSILIAKDRKSKTLQEVKEAAVLFQSPAPGKGSKDNALIASGHIYLARLFDRNNQAPTILLKILVLAYTPGESVTFRWERL